MFRVFITLLFIVLFLWGLSYEFKRKVSFTKYWKWIASALLVQGLSDIAFGIISGKTGNFIYHAVGGGVMSALFFIYLLKTYSLKLSWRVEIVILYAFVSALGVLNELAEYLYELLGLGTLSFDSHDTWRDLTANTLGAIAAWLVYRMAFAIRKKQISTENT